jgi:mono/diheme cytochrome c family protein
MRRHCGLTVSIVAGALWICSTSIGQAQPGAPPPAPATLALPPAVSAQQSLDNYLKFDADEKTVTVTNGAPDAHFTFTVTNISSEDVVINYIVGSCHCTVAQMPSTPWKLAAKEGGEFSAVMEMAGTPAGGEKFKTLTVGADKGIKVLNVTTKVLPEPAAMTEMDRTNNLKLATADRQAVFKGDCIQCHVTPARDAAGHEKLGLDLYTAVCGICHEAAHQATFVPNLHRLPEPTSAEFWRNWIMHGKPGTLMPAFAKTEGGILSDQQVDSLVQYLSATIPAHPVAVHTSASPGIAK